jgi:hypothetical protein
LAGQIVGLPLRLLLRCGKGRRSVRPHWKHWNALALAVDTRNSTQTRQKRRRRKGEILSVRNVDAKGRLKLAHHLGLVIIQVLVSKPSTPYME